MAPGIRVPKHVPLIPDEVVLRELDTLAPSICVTASQAAMVLGVSVPQLEERRRAGSPPPFVSDGDIRGKVRYSVGALRDHIRENTHRNTQAARTTAKARAAGMAFSTFAEFVASSSYESVWPFVIAEHGRPVDLLRSLSMDFADEPECVWLTLEGFGLGLAAAAVAERVVAEHTELDHLLPSGVVTCRRCGQPVKHGHVCKRI